MGDIVSNVCDIVMKRVFMPRVGVLWSSAGPKMYQWQSCDGVTWVHYVPENFSEAFKVDNNPRYFVESLEDPRRELLRYRPGDTDGLHAADFRNIFGNPLFCCRVARRWLFERACRSSILAPSSVIRNDCGEERHL